MTTSSSPPDGQPSTANATSTGKKRPVLWMVIAGVAVLAAIGLGVWAVKVHSDLEDQTAATQAAEAQAAAQAEAAAAVAAEVEKINASNEVFVVSNEDVAQAESEVAAAEEAVAAGKRRGRRGQQRCVGSAGRGVQAARRARASPRGARPGTGGAPAGESLRARFARSDLGARESRCAGHPRDADRVERLCGIDVRIGRLRRTDTPDQRASPRGEALSCAWCKR